MYTYRVTGYYISNGQNFSFCVNADNEREAANCSELDDEDMMVDTIELVPLELA